LFVASDGGIGHFPGESKVGPDFVHLLADIVDFGELFGREQAVGNEGAVYEKGSLVGDGGNEIASAEPGIAPKGAKAFGFLFDIGIAEGSELAGIEVELTGRRR
jgi:hypothetical protein